MEALDPGGPCSCSPARGGPCCWKLSEALDPGGPCSLLPCSWRPLLMDAPGSSRLCWPLLLAPSLLEAPAAGSSRKLSTPVALAPCSLAPGGPCCWKLSEDLNPGGPCSSLLRSWRPLLLEALRSSRPQRPLLLAPALLEAPAAGSSRKFLTPAVSCPFSSPISRSTLSSTSPSSVEHFSPFSRNPAT